MGRMFVQGKDDGKLSAVSFGNLKLTGVFSFIITAVILAVKTVVFPAVIPAVIAAVFSVEF